MSGEEPCLLLILRVCKWLRVSLLIYVWLSKVSACFLHIYLRWGWNAACCYFYATTGPSCLTYFPHIPICNHFYIRFVIIYNLRSCLLVDRGANLICRSRAELKGLSMVTCIPVAPVDGRDGFCRTKLVRQSRPNRAALKAACKTIPRWGQRFAYHVGAAIYISSQVYL